MKLEDDISYRKNGAVALFNSGGVIPRGEIYDLICENYALFIETGGAYDITVLPLVLAWGFDTDEPRLPGQSEIDSALVLVGGGNVILGEDGAYSVGGAKIDLSAAGKGAACQKACEIYASRGATGAVVTVGGSVGLMGVKDGKLFTVAVRDPFELSQSIALLTLTDSYISTSGSYEKHFTANGKEYHHLLDTSTGYPVENELVSVTVVCSDGALSDMLSSACFCLGIEKSLPVLKNHSAQALFVREDGKVFVTPGMVTYLDCDSYEVLPE